MKNLLSFVLGFILLFAVYHFPEFFSSFWIMAVCKIGFLVLAIILCRMQGWKFLEGYGLGCKKNFIKHLTRGLFIGFIAFSLSLVLLIGFSFEKLQNIQPPLFFLRTLPMVLLMTFFPSIAEDILTRGYLYGHLKFLKPFTWILISASVYLLNHFWRLNEPVSVLLYLFILGLLLAFCVYVFKSLWLALGIHWGSNIAFELSRQGVDTYGSDSNNSNWALVLVWSLVLGGFLLKYYRVLKMPVSN